MARRLAAILAADVVGYSRLMEADEAGTHGRLKALQTEIIRPLGAQLHGRIVELMDDGALAEFPVLWAQLPARRRQDHSFGQTSPGRYS